MVCRCGFAVIIVWNKSFVILTSSSLRTDFFLLEHGLMGIITHKSAEAKTKWRENVVKTLPNFKLLRLQRNAKIDVLFVKFYLLAEKCQSAVKSF